MYNIITKPGCVHCVSAKQLLDSKGIPYTEQNIGTDITIEEVKTAYPQIRTVPVVSYNGEFIGGYAQLVERIQDDNRQLLTE